MRFIEIVCLKMMLLDSCMEIMHICSKREELLSYNYHYILPYFLHDHHLYNYTCNYSGKGD